MISFPAIRPTTRNFESPTFATLDPQYVGTIEYPRLLGSKPGKAKLSMSFENITDSEAALIVASYINSLSGFFPIQFPVEIVAGIEETLLAEYILNIGHMKWYFSSPPQQDSVKAGISIVRAEFIGDF